MLLSLDFLKGVGWVYALPRIDYYGHLLTIDCYVPNKLPAGKLKQAEAHCQKLGEQL
jgi:hypothetical protein